MKSNNQQSNDLKSFKSGLYRHYKGNDYQVIDTVKHSETEELLVLYKPQYGQQDLWVRPYNMFFEKVLVDERWVDRFKFVE